MLNLSELAFKVNTDALVNAAEKIAALGKSVENLQGSFSKLEKSSSSAEKAQAQANKANAEAALANAKAAKEAAQAEVIRTKSLQETTKATDESVRSTKASVSILERQTDIYNFVAQGFTRGQASVLAMAKAAGVAADEIAQIGKTMQATAGLIGGDAFDKSNSALKSLAVELRKTKEVQRLYNEEIPLTRKQMEGLARDKIRLIEVMKSQGRKLSEIKVAVKDLNIEYINTAASLNRLTNAEDAADRARKEAATALGMIDKEMQRVNFALQGQNAELNKGTANALNRFEQNLKRSGLTLDQQRIKMDEYRKALLQLEKSKSSGQTDYISRALGPQITDIFVGLATGQSPLTVMLQQGGQLRDQFALAGVAAKDMGSTMRTAAREMVTSVAAVAGAFKDLLVGAFIDTGKGIVNMIGNMTMLSQATEWARYQLTLYAMTGSKFGAVLLEAFNVARVAVITFAATMAATGVGALIAMAVALKQVISENNELAKSLALSGGSLAISQTTAIGYIKQLQEMGVTTGTATEALVAMAKEGGFTKDQILMVGKAAADMSTYAGIAVEDTVKAFDKMKDKPVDAMIELAKKTGMVAPEVIKLAIELEKQGKTAELTALSMKTLADVSGQQVTKMKENYNGFSLFMIELGQKIKNFFSESFKTLFLATDPREEVLRNISDIDKKISEVGGNLESLGTTWSFLGIKGNDKLLNELKAQRLELEDQLLQIDMQTAAKDYQYEQDMKANAKAATYREAELKHMDEVTKKRQQLEEIKRKFEGDNSPTNKEEKRVRDIAITQAQRELDEAIKKANKKDPADTKQENYYASLMRKLTNEAIAAETEQQKLTKAFTAMLELAADPRFLKLSDNLRANAFEILNKAHNAELATEATKKEAEAEELLAKILGKSQKIGKDYYDTFNKLQKFKDGGFISQEQLEEAIRALYNSTPVVREYIKEQEAAINAVKQFDETLIAQRNTTTLEEEALNLKISLLGKTTKEQEILNIETQRSIALKKVDNELEKQRRALQTRAEKDIGNGVFDAEEYERQVQEAEENAAKQRNVINGEVAYKYAESLQKEIDAIRSGISESLATALFEGGKEGSKKLRDVVVSTLRKKITLQLDTVVNAVINSTLGALLGGAGGSALTGGAGGGGLLGTVLQGTQLYSGLTSGTGVLGTIGGWLGMGGATSAVTGAITSAGATGLGLTAGSTGLGLNAGAAGLGLKLGGATTTGATAATGSGLMSSVSAAMPWVLGAAALFSIIKGMDDSGTYHTGGLASYSAMGGSKTSTGWDTNFGTGFGGVETGQSTIDSMATLSKGIVSIFDGVAKTFGKTAGYEVATAFADDSSKDGAWGGFRVALEGVEILNWDDFRTSKWAPKEFGDGEEGYKQYLQTITKDTKQILLDMDLPAWANNILSSVGDTAGIEALVTAIGEIAKIQTTFEALADYSKQFVGLTDEARSGLLRLFGTADNMQNLVSSFLGSFYSEQEKFDIALGNMTEMFAAQNAVMPQSKESYRSLVEAQDLSTESGRKMYSFLLELHPAFLELSNMFDNLQARTKELTNEGDNLQIEALKLLGKEEEALALQRKISTVGYTEEQKALWDSNRATEKYIDTLKEQAETTEKINALIPNVLKKIFSETDYANYQYNEAAKTLFKNGLGGFADIDSAASYLMGSTKEQISKAAIELWNLGNLTDDQRKTLLEVTSAVVDLKDESQKAADKIKEAFKSAGDDIIKYIRDLTTTRGGLATPTELLAKTRQVYQADLAAAQGGDAEAAKRLVNSAKDYIEAQKKTTASSDITNTVISNIVNQLQSLGFVQDMLKSGSSMFIPQYAKGGVFTNSVVSSPTLFNVAEMGEKGPEAVMPLIRTSSGSLGVTADNSSTNALLVELVTEVRELRSQQTDESNLQAQVTLKSAEVVAEKVASSISSKNWSNVNKPRLE